MKPKKTYEIQLWPNRQTKRVRVARHADAEATARRWFHATEGAERAVIRPVWQGVSDWQQVCPVQELPRLSWPAEAYAP